MKEFRFEIPSTCIEVVEVKANSLEEAVQKIINSECNDITSHIPESEYAITINEECILECYC